MILEDIRYVLTLISPLWHDGCYGYVMVPVRTISYEIVRQLLSSSIKDYEYLSGFHFFRIMILFHDRIYMIGLSIWIEW